MLYHANSAPTADVLFHCYEDKGFKESENIYVGETGFSFVIRSILIMEMRHTCSLELLTTHASCMIMRQVTKKKIGYQSLSLNPIQTIGISSFVR